MPVMEQCSPARAASSGPGSPLPALPASAQHSSLNVVTGPKLADAAACLKNGPLVCACSLG